jgi:cellulose synthase (UDP-forming)
MFVTMMGHFGRQTGLPTLRVAVAGPDALVKGADSDFLVLGIGTDQPGFEKLADYMPVSLPDGKIQVHDTQGFFAPIHRAWWKMRPDEHTESGDLLASGAPDAIIEGIESPFAASGTRSIVTIRLKNAAIFEPFIHTFLFVQQASDIQGSVALLIGNRFQSFRIGANVYHTGFLPWWTRLSIWFMAVPWLVAVFLLLFAFLLAIWMREWLRHKARARLKMHD